MSTFPRLALVTCREFPDLEDDDRHLLEPLRRRGLDPQPVVWDDPTVDWDAFDLAVLRSTWDYPTRRKEFVNWASQVPRLANPAALVAWNTDKRYLLDLAGAGVPVVPTTWLEPGDEVALPDDGQYVLKPSVGAGSIGAGRYRLDDARERDLAAAHAAELLAGGATVMVQPYLPAVDADGEAALMFFEGRFSHAIRKHAILTGPASQTGELFRPERIDTRTPDPAELETATRVLAALPGGQRPLYARVDLLPGPDGRPVLLELELTEPSLFLGHDPEATTRLADAIAATVRAGER